MYPYEDTIYKQMQTAVPIVGIYIYIYIPGIYICVYVLTMNCKDTPFTSSADHEPSRFGSLTRLIHILLFVSGGCKYYYSYTYIISSTAVCAYTCDYSGTVIYYVL